MKLKPLVYFLLLIAVSATLSFNLLPRPKTTFEVAKEKKDHQVLAQIFLQNNDYVNAKKEDKNLITDLDKINEEIKRWENITNNYPNYRDGYIKLAILNWQVFREEQAQFYLSRVRELDPNLQLPLLP